MNGGEESPQWTRSILATPHPPSGSKRGVVVHPARHWRKHRHVGSLSNHDHHRRGHHNNIYNGLLKITYDRQTVDFVPDLAHRWEIVGDCTHVFHLHKE